VSLSKELGTYFTVPRDSAEPIGKWPRLVDVSRRDGIWEVILEGLWREKITLNTRYEVTKFERVQ
jgi:hypothetical protein